MPFEGFITQIVTQDYGTRIGAADPIERIGNGIYHTGRKMRLLSDQEGVGFVAVTIPVSLTPEEQASLVAQAKAEGVSVDVLLHRAVLQIIAAAPDVTPQQLTADQWEKEFNEWLDSLPAMPTLSDEAISRESIYTREDEW